jgi:hypothetical protein
MNHLKKLIILSATLLVALTSTALAGNGRNPLSLIVPPEAHYGGKSHAQWNQEYWFWTASILGETADFPPLDLAGKNIEVNQQGPVFFLPSTWTAPWTSTPTPLTGPAEQRSASVPAGKAIFAALDGGWFHSRNGWYDPTRDPVEFAATIADRFGTWFPFDFTLEIDGVIVPIDGSVNSPYLVNSGVFALPVPDGSALRAAMDPSMPSLVYPCVEIDFHVIIKPLPVGQHTIRIRAMDNWENFGLEYIAIDWNITVTP